MSVSVSSVSSLQLSASEFSHFSSLLESMRFKVENNRIHAPSFFHDWDRARSGHISKPQFARCLLNIGFKLSHEDVELLSRVYSSSTDNTQASYKAYLDDLANKSDSRSSNSNSNSQQLSDSAGPSSPTLARSFGGSSARLTGSTLTHANLIRKLQVIVKRQRKHINDLFDDFDQLRKRRVSAQQFRRCLDVGGFNLSEEEFQLLRNNFADRDDQNLVKYDDLVKEVNSAFVPLDIEQHPTQSPEEFSSDQNSQFAPSNPSVCDLIAHFGYLTHTRRILLKPSFHHFDKANHGDVTVSQFQSVVSSLFPTRVESAELDAIAAVYQSPQQVGLVNYGRFVADVTAAEEEYERTYLSRALNLTGNAPALVQDSKSFSGSGSILVPSHVNIQPQIVPVRDLAGLINHLRDYSNKQRIINIETIFYDFDPLRHGFVSSTRFFRSLALAGLGISQSEADLLCSEFRSYKEDNAVDYVKFAATLSSVPQI